MIKLMDYMIYIALVVFGLLLGSFAGAQVWRLRARQLIADKKAGEKVDAKEYKQLIPLVGRGIKSDRSQCLHCGHVLSWFDLLPLVSWMSTRGNCRYCKESIGWFEPIMEASVALVFVLSYVLWPMPLEGWIDWSVFVLWLAIVVGMAILFAYDKKWFLLPDRVVFPSMALAMVMAGLRIANESDIQGALFSLAGAAIILSGLYFMLWVGSKGRWIGFGDVKLGLVLAFILIDWRLAFIALFAANLVGCILVIPGMVRGKLSRDAHIPFGPLLIIGATIAFFVGGPLVEWYSELVYMGL